jgi:hypothetical protein
MINPDAQTIELGTRSQSGVAVSGGKERENEGERSGERSIEFSFFSLPSLDQKNLNLFYLPIKKPKKNQAGVSIFLNAQNWPAVVIDAGRRITLRSANASDPSLLDLGRLSPAIVVAPGGTLALSSLVVSGTATAGAAERSRAYRQPLVRGTPLSPSVALYPNSTLEISGTTVYAAVESCSQFSLTTRNSGGSPATNSNSNGSARTIGAGAGGNSSGRNGNGSLPHASAAGPPPSSPPPPRAAALATSTTIQLLVRSGTSSRDLPAVGGVSGKDLGTAQVVERDSLFVCASGSPEGAWPSDPSSSAAATATKRRHGGGAGAARSPSPSPSRPPPPSRSRSPSSPPAAGILAAAAAGGAGAAALLFAALAACCLAVSNRRRRKRQQQQRREGGGGEGELLPFDDSRPSTPGGRRVGGGGGGGGGSREDLESGESFDDDGFGGGGKGNGGNGGRGPSTSSPPFRGRPLPPPLYLPRSMQEATLTENGGAMGEESSVNSSPREE